MVLRISLNVIAQSLQNHCPGGASVNKAALHIGAVAFVHRSSSSLNGQVHFHVCVVDGAVQAAPVAALLALPMVLFHSEPAIRVGNPGIARGFMSVPTRDASALVVEWPIRFFFICSSMVSFKGNAPCTTAQT
jgi:hypothetical protein